MRNNTKNQFKYYIRFLWSRKKKFQHWNNSKLTLYPDGDDKLYQSNTNHLHLVVSTNTMDSFPICPSKDLTQKDNWFKSYYIIFDYRCIVKPSSNLCFQCIGSFSAHVHNGNGLVSKALKSNLNNPAQYYKDVKNVC